MVVGPHEAAIPARASLKRRSNRTLTTDRPKRLASLERCEAADKREAISRAPSEVHFEHNGEQ